MMTNTVVSNAPWCFLAGVFFLLIGLVLLGFVLLVLVLLGLLLLALVLLAFLFFDLVDIERKLQNEE